MTTLNEQYAARILGKVSLMDPVTFAPLSLRADAPRSVTVSPATASFATPYSAGDCVGALMTFAALVAANDLPAWLARVTVDCKSAQTAPLDLVIYDANPTATTFTDNAAMALNAADFDKVALVVSLADWRNLGTPSVLQAFPKEPIFPAPGSDTLYANLIARAALTLGSASDLTVKLISEP